jgi:hemoglobin/transferrin/lactoferrin receptor protein
MVQKTSYGQGSPYIRGFTGFRNVFLIDGIRLNNSVFRDGPNQYWNTIDPYTIDRLEVVKGPASVLYGSDAIGGAVNALHRRPSGYGEGLQWKRRIYTRLASAERSLVTRGEVDATVDEWLGVLVGGTWQEYGDVHGGKHVGKQPFTGYRVCSGDFRLEYHPDPDSTLTLAHYQFYQDDAWRTHKTIHGIAWEGTTVGGERERRLDQGRSLSYARYRKENLGGFVEAYELTFSFQQTRERRRRVRDSRGIDHQGFDVQTYGLGAQFETPSPIGRWTYGLEWYHDEVSSFADKFNPDGSLNKREIQGPVADDARYDLLGLYVQDEIPVGDQLEVILGGRYTFAAADADRVKDPDTGRQIGVDENWCSLVGSARAAYFLDPERHWNLFGGVSQGFRSPNLSDLTRLDTARSNEIETPSPGLDPEKYITYEAGVKTSYDRVQAQAAYYYTSIDDMIVRSPTGRVIGGNNEVAKSNAGDGYVHGVEVQADWEFVPQWTAFGNFAWLYGEVETYPTSAPVVRSEPLSRLMPPTGQLGLRWDHPDGKVWLQSTCTIAGEADELSTRDAADTQRIPPGGTPGHTVFDLRGGWRVKQGLEVWGAVENLTNNDYRVHGSGVNEPGVNFKIGLSWEF